jgi:hypothetical protein
MTSRTDHYMARVAAHLPSLPNNAARAAFIEAELAKWEERYAAFIRTVDRGIDPGPATAFDFTETIAALGAEQAKYREPVAA